MNIRKGMFGIVHINETNKWGLVKQVSEGRITVETIDGNIDLPEGARLKVILITACEKLGECVIKHWEEIRDFIIEEFASTDHRIPVRVA